MPKTSVEYKWLDEQCADSTTMQKKKITSARASDQKAVDKALLTNIKKVQHLTEYLRTTFSLRKGDRPHEMKW